MKKIKEMFGSAQSRYGTYSTLLTVVVIAIVIVLNMVAGQFPQSWRNIDLSSNHLYEITDQSKALLKSLGKEVEIHVLADKSSADERIVLFIDKYAALSKKVSVKYTDPVLHPTVLAETGASENTIIVSCKETGKSTNIAMTDMVQIDEYSYYYSGEYKETAFDAEGQLTSAVNYVVSETTSQVYYTAGHGESALTTTIKDLFEKSNITTQEINTLTQTEIPKDCELLFLYAPTTDFTKDEISMLSTYMQEGGNVFYIMGETDKQLTNLNGFLAEYGLEVQEGFAADTQKCYQQNPFYVLPTLSAEGGMTNGMQSQTILMLYPKAIKEVTPARDSITIEAFMTTSENGGYIASEKKQEKGTSILGAVVTEEDARLTVITSQTIIDENLVKQFSNLENATLFMNTVTENFENASNASIPTKSLEITRNTVQNAGLFTFVVILGVPVVVLVSGFMKWLKRRKA